MSHITTIKVEIKDLQALRDACKAVGLEFRENQKTYKWYGQSMGDYPLPVGFTKKDLGKCDHAIGVKGKRDAYEIGVCMRDGKYTMLWDFWNGGFGLQEIAGTDCCNLTQAYARNVSVKEARKIAAQHNMTVSETTDAETGEIVLTLRSYD